VFGRDIFFFGVFYFKMANKKNQTKGIWIPEEIKTDKKLDWANKALLSEIYSLCELPDGCIASDNHFGKLLGIGRTSANKRVNKLEEMGYITCKNHYKGKVCIGRSIIKGSSIERHTVVPQVLKGSSDDIQMAVPDVEVGSSVENTINTFTNSHKSIQEPIQYTGGISNTVTSQCEFLKTRYADLVSELVEKSSLGEGIFNYIEPANLDMFRDVVDEIEYKLVYPILTKVIDIDKKLHGN
jgi:biotin operon repressor